ncbi:hypothetical protein, partial [Bacillus velezensis]|uniref:hypothetical protein n=1 Tax=Bacillus velezensis TaxID=492670 RepID=UPI0020BD54AA
IKIEKTPFVGKFFTYKGGSVHYLVGFFKSIEAAVLSTFTRFKKKASTTAITVIPAAIKKECVIPSNKADCII